MVICSAPGKVILFGEHAVVYGMPALAAAIEKRTYVTVQANISDKIKINSADSSGMVSIPIENLGAPSKDTYRYVKRAVYLTFQHQGKRTGLDIEIESRIPPASGLGSSAAVTVAAILAVSVALGNPLDKKTISSLAHRVEIDVQGAASPTDTSTSTFGGIQFIEPGKIVTYLDSPLNLVVGYSGMKRSTKVLVENVRKIKEKYPPIMDPIIQAIGKITEEGKMKIIENDLGAIGELMNLNQGLLDSLGVSNRILWNLVYSARDAGAFGAKLTGAGGGGCMIALVNDDPEKVIAAIEKEGCKAFYAPISKEGVKIEGDK